MGMSHWDNFLSSFILPIWVLVFVLSQLKAEKNLIQQKIALWTSLHKRVLVNASFALKFAIVIWSLEVRKIIESFLAIGCEKFDTWIQFDCMFPCRPKMLFKQFWYMEKIWSYTFHAVLWVKKISRNFSDYWFLIIGSCTVSFFSKIRNFLKSFFRQYFWVFFVIEHML